MGTEAYLGMPPPRVVAWIKAERDRKGPLFFEANEPGASVAMLCWDDNSNEQTTLKCHLWYSTDRMATWAAYDGSIVELDDCAGNRVYFMADPTNPNIYGFHAESYTHYFKTDKSVKAGGNIQFLLEPSGTWTDVPEQGFRQLFGYNSECSSLTTAPELPATTLDLNCYWCMFEGCSSLTAAPALPAKTLDSGCYQYMFKGCSSLSSAPELPATSLAWYCYASMFYGCTSLTSAPAILPATSLPAYCYLCMFEGCSSLSTAPALPAKTLADDCYSCMFKDCLSLTATPELPATTLADDCYYHMFDGCSSLVSAPAILPAETLAHYCYAEMFFRCTSLTTAPKLPATNLVFRCYDSMFNRCSSLSSIDVNFTEWNSSTQATLSWVYEVAPHGIFTCPGALSAVYSSNKIPEGWTIIRK